jgi:hypothetical protein
MNHRRGLITKGLSEMLEITFPLSLYFFKALIIQLVKKRISVVAKKAGEKIRKEKASASHRSVRFR